MVPLVRIGLTTPPLPRVCSTTEPQRHKTKYFYPKYFHLSSPKLLFTPIYFNQSKNTVALCTLNQMPRPIFVNLRFNADNIAQNR